MNLIQKIEMTPRLNGLRWATTRYPDGTVARVLQEEWVSHVQVIDADGLGSETTVVRIWRDVPTHEVFYEPQK